MCIRDRFKTERIVDVTLIEETLLYAMADEFDTNVEDDSALPIAAGVIEIYKQCDAQDYTTVEKLYSDWNEKQKTKAAKRIVQVAQDPMNPDVSDSEDEDDEEEEITNDDERMDVDEVIPEGPLVDEDGFEVVQKKGRRKHH